MLEPEHARSEPVPPMAALISEILALGNWWRNQFKVLGRQPFCAVMLPPR